VPPLWKDGAAVIIGGGPSVNQTQIDLVHEAHSKGIIHVIAINNAYQIAPWADVLYAADRAWWGWHYEESSKNFQGLRITSSKYAKMKYPDVTWIEGEAHDQGLSKRRDSIVQGRIGGYQTINLAVNFGATRILLLGYDMRTVGGMTHWHGNHPNRQRPIWKHRIEHFKNMLPDLKERGIEVINCTPGSALDAFPMGDIADELER